MGVAAGANAAVTPLGSLDADRFTLPLKPARSVTLMVLLAAAAPGIRVRLPAEDERLKLGPERRYSTMVVVLLRAPEVPVTVTV